MNRLSSSLHILVGILFTILIAEEQSYLGDSQYISTDRYSEYFEDDENKADRFADEYRENFTD